MLKKVFTSVALCAVCVTASAQYAGPNSMRAPTNVKELLAAGYQMDDYHVTLEGKILNQISHDKYTFSDGTGSVTVEIDRYMFPQGKPVGPNTRVRIVGEFDHEYVGRSEIDVKQLTVLD
jgi:uncharacterized protein (TIGR00156 family)